MSTFVAYVNEAGSRFEVTIPDLPGFSCMGETEEEAKMRSAEALGAHLARLEEAGAEIPAPRPLTAFGQDGTNPALFLVGFHIGGSLKQELQDFGHVLRRIERGETVVAEVHLTLESPSLAIPAINWGKVDATTDEDIAIQIAADPDTAPIWSAEEIARGRRVTRHSAQHRGKPGQR